MKRIHFAIVGAAAIALAACGSNTDQDVLGNDVETNVQDTGELNALANEAANDAAAETLGNQMDELNDSAPDATEEPVVDNGIDPTSEEAVQGM